MKIKKYLYHLIAAISFMFSHKSYGDYQMLSEANVDPKGKSIFEDARGGIQSFEDILFFTKNFLFNILWILVVGAFIYVGFLFITARGKPEEFKKAWKYTLFIVIGIALFTAAWGIVNIIAGLDF